jgi:chorismate mutase
MVHTPKHSASSPNIHTNIRISRSIYGKLYLNKKWATCGFDPLASQPIFSQQSQTLCRSMAQQSSFATSFASKRYSDLSDTLSLSNIRKSLILMEDTIIFGLIERAQFARNAAVYDPGAIPVPVWTRDGRQMSLLEYLLRETEQVHGRIRRYTNPDENAFFPEDLPPLVLPPLEYPQVLWPPAAGVNVNSKIMEMYLGHLLPEITPCSGDDRNYGSAAMHDVVILQALSRRIHYGKFVAEAKFQSQTDKYTELIKCHDAQGILELLTDRAVELKVVERVKLKAATFGQDLNSSGHTSPDKLKSSEYMALRISPEAVADLYEQWVMPLTKEVEIEYLLRRLDNDKSDALV